MSAEWAEVVRVWRAAFPAPSWNTDIGLSPCPSRTIYREKHADGFWPIPERLDSESDMGGARQRRGPATPASADPAPGDKMPTSASKIVPLYPHMETTECSMEAVLDVAEGFAILRDMEDGARARLLADMRVVVRHPDRAGRLRADGSCACRSGTQDGEDGATGQLVGGPVELDKFRNLRVLRGPCE